MLIWRKLKFNRYIKLIRSGLQKIYTEEETSLIINGIQRKAKENRYEYRFWLIV